MIAGAVPVRSRAYLHPEDLPAHACALPPQLELPTADNGRRDAGVEELRRFLLLQQGVGP